MKQISGILKTKKILLISGACVVVLGIIAALVVSSVVLPEQHYKKALEDFEAGDYISAYETLQKVPETKNETAQLLPYYAAYASFSAENYADAAEKFKALDDYADCPDMAVYCAAQVSLTNKQYSDAYMAFASLEGFRDSAEMLPECRYRLANDLMAEKDFAGALERFSALENYKDSAEQAQECSYQIANELLEQKSYGEAYNAFSALGEYKNSVEMQSECRYRLGTELMQSGDLAGALERFSALPGYKDSDMLAKDCQYQQAVALSEQGTLDTLTQAARILSQLGSYKDAAEQLIKVNEAIEQAKRVPYSRPSDAFFDIDCTNTADIYAKIYKACVKNKTNVKIFSYTPENNKYTWLEDGSVSESISFKDVYEGHTEYRIDTSSISSDNQLVGSIVHVNGGIQNGYTYSGSNLTFTRFGESAIVVRGGTMDKRKTLMSQVLRGYTVSIHNFDGIPGGAIIFDEYNYISLNHLRFSRVEPYIDNAAQYTTRAKLKSGSELYISNWCYDWGKGTLSETYHGFDIYVGKSNEAVSCQVYPDVFIQIRNIANPVVGKQIMKDLIDHYQQG